MHVAKELAIYLVSIDKAGTTYYYLQCEGGWQGRCGGGADRVRNPKREKQAGDRSRDRSDGGKIWEGEDNVISILKLLI